MLKRSHFLPLLLASSPLVVTTIAVDTAQNNQHVVHHLRHSTQPLVTQQQQVPDGIDRNNKNNMQNNQQRTSVKHLQRQRRLGGKSSKKSKTHRSKSSKTSRDGYHHYSDNGDDDDVDDDSVSNNIDSLDNNGGEAVDGDEKVKGEDDDNDAVALGQAEISLISFDILSDSNSKQDSSSSSGMMEEDGNAVMGEGSEAKAEGLSPYNDRNEEAEGGGSASILGDGAAPNNQMTTTTTETELIDDGGASPTTQNNTNVFNKLQPNGRSTGAAVISLVSLGSIVVLSIGLYAHTKQTKKGAAGAAAPDNNVEGAEEVDDMASIWSASEEDAYIGDIGGDVGGPMLMGSPPQPGGVSSIAAMGMASPLALQLSGRDVVPPSKNFTPTKFTF